MDVRALLHRAADHAADHLESLAQRPVTPTADHVELRERLWYPLQDDPIDAAVVLEELVADATPGLIGSAGGRFFGFVIGGGVPAAVAADVLTTAWDQNAGLYAAGPSAAIVEEVAGAWLKDLLGLPPDASFAFTTGSQMAHVTCLAAARHHVLARVGWDVERDGLLGAPRVRILAGAEHHVTVDRALRYLGFGTAIVEPVACDGQGRMSADDLRDRLAAGPDAPTIVIAEVGNVNSGAVDPVGDIVAAAHERGAWVHVDGAFGLWLAASARRRHEVAGVGDADSWVTDAHKWLNVPYDSGLAFVAHPPSHRAATSVSASYLIQESGDGPRDQMDWTLEFSRRARGFAVYAAVRALGRHGIADLIDRCCDHAQRIADGLSRIDGVEIVNDVVMNQVLVDIPDVPASEVAAAVQAEGDVWLTATVWAGRPALRVSVSNWQTTDSDAERAIAAIARAIAARRRERPAAAAVTAVDED